jgi:DNA-binding transcriptional ArsR family regulator|tara:strand:- start:294 stop:629 length:336 start_codon:yes stop_codon:yes gene_type:complete
MSYNAPMNEENAAKCLTELGSPTRLAVFRLLVRASPDGMVVGDIQRRLQIPASTLSHHITKLAWAGLVEQRRRGRSLHCFAQTDVMNDLVTYLTAECCAGFGNQKTDQPAA